MNKKTAFLRLFSSLLVAGKLYVAQTNEALFSVNGVFNHNSRAIPTLDWEKPISKLKKKIQR